MEKKKSSRNEDKPKVIKKKYKVEKKQVENLIHHLRQMLQLKEIEHGEFNGLLPDASTLT